MEAKWTTDEIKFLIENYENIGPSKCSLFLKRSIRACQLKSKKLKLKFDYIKDYYKKENLEKTIKESYSYSDCLRKMMLTTRAGNSETLKRYIKLYSLDISHFYTDKSIYNRVNGILSLDEILVENSNYTRKLLKQRLFKEGLKENRCEECGQTEMWRGKRLTLIIDHINGVNNDNRIENLRILCPNCNATLETHCKGSGKINKKKEILCDCGSTKDKDSNKCAECYAKSNRKVERPSHEELLKEVEELGYCAVGRKYGVSDNSIRSWLGLTKREKTKGRSTV